MKKKELIKLWVQSRQETLRRSESKPKTLLKWAVWTVLAMILCGILVAGLTLIIILPTLPDINSIQNLVAAQSSTIYDRDGNVLYTIHGEENREVVAMKDISQNAVKAVLAIEDDQFYNHGAVDFTAILKAVCSQMHICSTPRGGSTITQQFIKNAFLSSEQTYVRKLKEIILSLELESKFTKDQILEMYLNRIPYGSSIYGIEKASNTFFGKHAKDLTLAEAAVLASIPKAPTFFSPYGSNKYPTINLSEDEILKKKITSEQQLVDINPDFVTKGLLGKTYVFGAEKLPDTVPADTTDTVKTDKNGKKIKTEAKPKEVVAPVVDPANDKTVKIYVKGRVDFVLGRMKDLGYITSEDYDSAIAEASKMEFKPYKEEIKAPHFVMYVKELLEQKYGKDQIEKGGLKITTTLDSKLQTLAETSMAKYADMIKTRYGANNGSFVALDPNTGQILTMVGSFDYWNDDIDGKVNVALRPRLPGSSFKPIVYASAFLQGYAPSTVLYDVETNFGGTYKPKNYDGTFSGPVTMRQALDRSLNIPAVKAAYLAGVPNVLDLARKMGIQLNQPDDWYGLSLALGAGEARLLDMVEAYSIFANGGYKMDPVSILKIEDRNGNILEQYTAPQNKSLILDPQVAYLINNVLSDAESKPEGFWRDMLSIPGQIAAAKTGTSNKEKGTVDYPADCWTIGYTKRIVAGGWVGNNDGSLLNMTGDGLNTAARFWHDFMVEATNGNPREDFDKPAGITWVKVSEKTGKLPSEYTPADSIKSEVFASFSVPKETDTAYKLVKIDKASGKLATEFTPESAVEEKPFFEHHSEFPDNPLWEDPVRKWAIDNKQDDVVPTQYDDVHTADTVNDKPSIVITSPSSLSTVSAPSVGVWADVSSKSGVNYVEYYWDDKLVDTVNSSPFKGTIPISAADNADGSTHTIKAIVYDSLYRSSQSSVDVKIAEDKTPPTIEFAYPGDGVKLDAGSSMVTQIKAEDEGGDIDKVEFYLDGEIGNTVKQPPYVWQFTVPFTTGPHDIEAIAYDFAGNQAKAKIGIVSQESSVLPTSDSSHISEPYKNQSFNEGDRVLVQASLSEEDQKNLKELTVFAQKGKKSIEIANASADPKTGGAYVYTFIWDKVLAGTYDLSLKIVLQDGRIRFSERVPVMVR
jgi:membrane peptidoglycan carboxypeptidase